MAINKPNQEGSPIQQKPTRWPRFSPLTLAQAVEHWLGRFEHKHWIDYYRNGFEELYSHQPLRADMPMDQFGSLNFPNLFEKIRTKPKILDASGRGPNAQLNILQTFLKFLDQESQTQPLPQAPPADRRHSDYHPNLAPAHEGPHIILVVDDNADNRAVVRFKLRREIAAGLIQIEEAENGYAAINKAFEKKPHLILMDMAMPEMNGYETTKKLRSMHFHNPIWALTASVEARDQYACSNAGCNQTLVKPVGRQFRGTIKRFFQL